MSQSVAHTNQIEETFKNRFTGLQENVLNQFQEKPSTKTLIGETESGEEIAAERGDVIAYSHTGDFDSQVSFLVVLSTHELTGLTVYDLEEQRYGYYHTNKLAEHMGDKTKNSLKIISGLLPLTYQNATDNSEHLQTLLNNHDLRSIPKIPRTPDRDDFTLEITNDVSVKIGDVISTHNCFELVLNLSGADDEETDPEKHGITKYNLNTGTFGFYPLKLMRHEFNSNTVETEVLTDPWNIRSTEQNE